MTSIAAAQSLFELPDEQTLELNSSLAVGVSNALQRFRAIQQPLANFTVVVGFLVNCRTWQNGLLGFLLRQHQILGCRILLLNRLLLQQAD